MDDLDSVFKALADPTRRALLDLLRSGPKTTSELVAQFPDLSRFAVMKHLDVLRGANLVVTQAAGRRRNNSINVTPLRAVFERWATPFQELWSQQLAELKRSAESPSP